MLRVPTGTRPEIPRASQLPGDPDQPLGDMLLRYIALMKSCWNGDPQARPVFSEIVAALANMRDAVAQATVESSIYRTAATPCSAQLDANSAHASPDASMGAATDEASPAAFEGAHGTAAAPVARGPLVQLPHGKGASLPSTCQVIRAADLELGPLLGSGSFGQVCQAFWLGALVAVKILTAGSLQGEALDDASGTSTGGFAASRFVDEVCAPSGAPSDRAVAVFHLPFPLCPERTGTVHPRAYALTAYKAVQQVLDASCGYIRLCLLDKLPCLLLARHCNATGCAPSSKYDSSPVPQHRS